MRLIFKLSNFNEKRTSLQIIQSMRYKFSHNCLLLIHERNILYTVHHQSIYLSQFQLKNYPILYNGLHLIQFTLCQFYILFFIIIQSKQQMKRQTKIQETLTYLQQQKKLIFQKNLQKARMQVLRQRRMQKLQQTYCESDSQQSQNEEQKQNFLQVLQEREQSLQFSNKKIFSNQQYEEAMLQTLKKSFNQNSRNSQKIQLKFIHRFSELPIQNEFENDKRFSQNHELKSIKQHPLSLLNNTNEQILFGGLKNFQQQKNLSKDIQNNFNRIDQKKQYEIPLTQIDEQESPISMKKTRNCKKDKIQKSKLLKQDPLKNYVYQLIVKIMNLLSFSDKEYHQTKNFTSLGKGIK